jgi:hypothetical protein
MDFDSIEFTKLERNSRGQGNADATYHINAKGIGVLKFTSKGADKLEDLIGTDYKGLFNLYINKETQSLAFEFSERGRFKFSGLTKKFSKPTLSYNDLSKAFPKSMFYMIIESKKYTFILVPIDLLNKPEAQPTTVETQASGVEEPPKLTDNASPAKKAKGKKK